jgi:L-lactate dehydrogenase complex protein LldG
MSDPVSSKEKVLKKLRKALLQKDIFFNPELDFDSDVFVKDERPLLEVFYHNFIAADGKIMFCRNPYHFLEMFLSIAEMKGWQQVLCLEDGLKNLLQQCEFPFLFDAKESTVADVGITGCDALVARTGSILLNTKNTLSRAISAFPPVHVVISYRNQLEYGFKDYFKKNDGTQTSSWSILTGPSRTSDIERELVLGAHGPKELYLFILDEDRQH